MPLNAASTVFTGQIMQTPTVDPPTAATRMRNTKISTHSKSNGNPKLSESRSVPSDETGKALSQAPLSLCVSGSRNLLCHTQHVFPISLKNRKVPVFLTTRVIWEGSTTTSPPPRLHILCKFVSVCYVNSKKNSAHQLAHRVHRGKERRQCGIFCFPTAKTTKFTGKPTCLYTSSSNDTLDTSLDDWPWAHFYWQSPYCASNSNWLDGTIFFHMTHSLAT